MTGSCPSRPSQESGERKSTTCKVDQPAGGSQRTRSTINVRPSGLQSRLTTSSLLELNRRKANLLAGTHSPASRSRFHLVRSVSFLNDLSRSRPRSCRQIRRRRNGGSRRTSVAQSRSTHEARTVGHDSDPHPLVPHDEWKRDDGMGKRSVRPAVGEAPSEAVGLDGAGGTYSESFVDAFSGGW